MTEYDINQLRPGDIVEIIDWPGFSNEKMRPFIGRQAAVTHVERFSNHVVLRLIDGDEYIENMLWSNRCIELVSEKMDADMKLLFE